jgi:hypothetical protein
MRKHGVPNMPGLTLRARSPSPRVCRCSSAGLALQLKLGSCLRSHGKAQNACAYLNL